MKTHAIRLAATRTGLFTSLFFATLTLVACANLVNFLNQYPYHQGLMGGQSDNVGSAMFNETFSRQQAEPVLAVPDWLRHRQPQVESVGIWL